MLAVHFGAGNIGRGFIGKLLFQSGFETCFVDVNERLINLLNERKKYKVILANEAKENYVVEKIFAINSMKNRDVAVNQIAKANLVTTAVGANILPLIAPLIADGLKKRIKETTEPLNIIACENVIGGSSLLKECVYEHLSEDEKKEVNKRVGFPNAAVDRIVPNQVNDDSLMVLVEPFYEWIVEETTIVGHMPNVKGITYVQDLKPYIERKLFTVNTGHAVCAYLGYLHGFETIAQAMRDSVIKRIVENTLKETGQLLTEKYGLNVEEHKQYREKIIKRFLNQEIKDEVIRVGRSPIRKLGPKERLVFPATQFLERLGEVPTYLAKSIAAALQFDYMEDSEAKSLQQTIQEKGVEEALKIFTGLSMESPLTKEILKHFHQFKKNRDYSGK